MAILFSYLLIFSLLPLISECRIIKRPINQIALSGSTVIFHCSVSNARNIVVWSFKDMVGNSIMISIKLEIVEKSGKYSINYRVVSASNRFHDLVVTNVNVKDSGLYTCIDSTDKEEASGSLTFIDIPFCYTKAIPGSSTKGNKFTCTFKVSGLIKMKGDWSCDFSLNTTTLFSEKILYEIIDLRHLKVTFYETSVETKAINTRDAPVCNLSISSTEIDWGNIRQKKGLDMDVPVFKYVLHPAGAPKFNISEGYNLKKGDFISCTTNSPLPVTYSMVVYTLPDQYIAFNHSSNVTQMNELGSYKIHCLVNNALNLKIIYEALKKIEVVEAHRITQCDLTSQECLFIPATFGLDNVVRVTIGLQGMLCQDIDRVKSCVYVKLPCYITSYQQGLLDAYRFLCDYGTRTILSVEETIESQYTVPNENLQTKYPYTILPLVYSNIMQIEPHEATNPVVIVRFNCRRLLDVATLFYHTYLAHLRRGTTVANWYMSFYSHYYGIQLFEPKYLKADEIRNNVNLSNCEEHGAAAQMCNDFKMCDRIYDMLIQTFSYGFIIVVDFAQFIEYVCDKNARDMHHCEQYLLNDCEPFTKSLFKPLSTLQILMCDTYLKNYLKHHDCFAKFFFVDRFRKSFVCAEKYIQFMRSISTQNSTQEDALAEACMATVTFLDCIEGEVTKRCGRQAGRLQRNLLRRVISDSIQDYFCYGSFTHSNHDVDAATSLKAYVMHFLLIVLAYIASDIVLVLKF